MKVAHRQNMVWLTLGCALASWLLAYPAMASPLQMPTSPLQNYYEEQRAIGAESSEALSRALLYTAERAPADRQLAILQQATLAAPTMAEPHLLRAKYLTRHLDFISAALAMRDAFVAVQADPLQSARWGLRLQGGLHRVLLGTLLVLAVLLLIRMIPFLDHLLASRLKSPRAVLMMILAIMMMFLWAFPALGTLLLLCLLAPFLGRSERAGLATLCVLLGAASLLLSWQQPDVLLADPTHRVARLARANIETLPYRQVRQLERDLPPSRERELVLGLQAARRQQWNDAHRWYVAGLAQDSTWAATYVNLANLFFALADYERATSGYRTAQTFAPNSPFPHANLAQTYMQVLQYEQSDHELNLATSLGFDAAVSQHPAWVHQEKPVFDVLLTRQDLRALATADVAENPQAAQAQLAAWRGPGWQGLPMHWMPWVLFVVALWMSLRLRWAGVAFECADCRRICCQHCVAPSDDGLALCCPRCEKLQSRRSGSAPSDASQAFSRPSRAQLADHSSPGLAALFPGAAFLVMRSPGDAILVVMLALIALNLFPTAAAAAGVFLLLYLPGLFKLRSARRTARA